MELKNKTIPYTHKALFTKGKPKVYSGAQLESLDFPLGGIGTGSISLGGWGQLRGAEIFNQPGKQANLDEVFFTLHAREGKGAPVTKVLQGPKSALGLTHFQDVSFTGRFPIAKVTFADEAMPLEVSIEAFNPFIPLNPDDSGIPVAMFFVHLENPGQNQVDAVLYANLRNLTGGVEQPGRNTYFERDGVSGIAMSTPGADAASPACATMALATPHPALQVQTHWGRGKDADSLGEFWKQASAGELKETRETVDHERGEVASLGLEVSLLPGDSVALPIWIIWHVPNVEESHKNYYSTLWNDARDLADYLANEHRRLARETRAFTDALFASTLPEAVMDAVSSQLSGLKTTACLRLEDGSLQGMGDGPHVWSYAQALPFLFPSLARTLRDAEMDSPSAGTVDVQMGHILNVYREWLISGDDAWLQPRWPGVKKILADTWEQWDKDKDGVMEGQQQSACGIEFLGPNSMMGGYYLGALRAAEEMAVYLGEDEQADEYHQLFEQGRAWLDAVLFNGEYYEQEVMVGAEPGSSHPLGKGCVADQLIGQWCARLLQLGDLFDCENVAKAMASIFKHNWQSGGEGEAGLLFCTWPDGSRPDSQTIQADEIWCGVEYQVASHLIYEGFVEEALAIVKAVRDRYDGARRNPWLKFGGGYHDARSLASFSLLPALSNFFYSASSHSLSFTPQIYKNNFASIFSVGTGWGMLRQKKDEEESRLQVVVLAGTLHLSNLQIGFRGDSLSVILDGESISYEAYPTHSGSIVQLQETLELAPGQHLTVCTIHED